VHSSFAAYSQQGKRFTLPIRLRELATKIAIEDNHDRFTALVKEFNQLLDGEKHQPNETRAESKPKTRRSGSLSDSELSS
jgi:hypothetical protein